MKSKAKKGKSKTTELNRYKMLANNKNMERRTGRMAATKDLTLLVLLAVLLITTGESGDTFMKHASQAIMWAHCL